MGSGGLRRILKRCTRFAFRIIIPPVPEGEVRRFSSTKAKLARLYNRISGAAALRTIFLLIGPFFRITGVKTPSASA